MTDRGPFSSITGGIRASTRRRAAETGEVAGGSGTGSKGGGGTVGTVRLTAAISLARAASHERQVRTKERLHVPRERSEISAFAVTRSPVRFEISLSVSVGTSGGANVREGSPVGRYAESKNVPPSCGRAQISANEALKSSWPMKLFGDSEYHCGGPSWERNF